MAAADKFEPSRVINQPAILRRRIENIPLLRRFWEEAERRIVDGEPESFWTCEDLLLEAARSSLLSDFIAHEFSCLMTHPSHGLPDSRENTVQVLANDRWQLHLTLHSPRSEEPVPALLHVPAEHVISTMVDGSIVFRRFRLPGGPSNNEVFDRTARLEPVEDSIVEKNAVLRMRAGVDTHYVRAPKAQSVSLNMMCMNVVSVRWIFDGATLAAKHAASGSVTDKRIEHAMRMLTMMPTASSRDTLEHLARHHETHFVRWTAIRELGRLDLSRAAQLMEAAATKDPHPHVRNAARKNLERLAAARPTARSEGV